jgi:hypothetical protein
VLADLLGCFGKAVFGASGLDEGQVFLSLRQFYDVWGASPLQ